MILHKMIFPFWNQMAWNRLLYKLNVSLAVYSNSTLAFQEEEELTEINMCFLNGKIRPLSGRSKTGQKKYIYLSYFFFPSPLYLWTVPKILDLRFGKNKKVTGTTSHTDYIFMLWVYSNHFSPYLFFYWFKTTETVVMPGPLFRPQSPWQPRDVL